MSGWTAEEDAAFRAAADRDPQNNGQAPVPRSSWLPVDLAPIVAGIQAGEIVGPVPALMARTDDVCLLYPGEVHSLAGEPESGKGWITLAAAAAELAADASVLYLDFEDSPASIITRLLAVGTTADAILKHFTYVRPCDPLELAALAALLDAREYTLAAIDGVSEAYQLLGLDPSDNLDAVRFLSTLARPIAERGAAVLNLDHVAKSENARGRYALGAQHKLAGVAVAYSTEVVKPPSRTDAGHVKLKVEKDRHGHVRGHAQGRVIAEVRITPADDGERVTVTLEPPGASFTDDGEFRPTHLMEKVSRLLEAEPGAGVNEIRRSVSGKGEFVDLAVRVLIAEKFVRMQLDRQVKRHFVIRKFRDDT